MLSRLFLRRKLFKGQFRLFMWLFGNNYIKPIKIIDTPTLGNFKINLNTANFLDACIYITGDYEQYLKLNYAQIIKPGQIVLDVGANIGFHTLFFSELVTNTGRVYAFEPIPVNYEAFENNLALNNYTNIKPIQKALGSTTDSIKIHIDTNSKNPGAFSLLAQGELNTQIDCITGDSLVQQENLKQVDFIKIDVEGYEIEVLKGLKETITKFRPNIIFEYDSNYQQKINADPKAIFYFLEKLNYSFFEIDGYGQRSAFNIHNEVTNAEILAIPN